MEIYNDLEDEMKIMNNNFLPINNYIENQKNIDEILKKYIQDFKFYNNDLNNNIKRTKHEFDKHNVETLYKFNIFEKLVNDTYE